MQKKILVIFGLLFILIIILLFRWSGYQFPNEKKHPEIPFFPKTTNTKEVTNKRVDSMFVRQYEVLKESNLLLVNYSKDSLSDQASSIAILTKAFKPIFYLNSSSQINYSFDRKRNLLLVVLSTSDSITKALAFGITQRKPETIKTLSISQFNELENRLEVVKHYTVNQGFTRGIFFIDKTGQIYFVKEELANQISKRIKLNEEDNFNFYVSIVMAGDSTIHTKNIKLFDNTVVSNQFKRLLAYGTPSSPGGDGNPPIFAPDKGWFHKWRHYFFRIKMGKEEAEFKTNLYYNSQTYFDELSEPKTDQDTLLYYSENRFYQFYAK